MKKTIITLTLLAGISLNLFAQREIPMFFDKELGLQTTNDWFTRRVSYSTDGSRIAVTYNNNKIAIWDTTTGREITRMTGHSENITGIKFSPNGRQLVSTSYNDTSIKIWDTVSGQLLRSISQIRVSNVSFSPDGNLITGSVGNDVKIWNMSNGSEIRTLTGHTDRIESVVYSPDGKYILTASRDSTIKIWDVGNGRNIRTINGNAFFRNAVYSPNGKYIAIFTEDDTIRIYNAENGQEIRIIQALFRGSGQVSSDLLYSPNGRQLVAHVWDDNLKGYTIKIFDPETGHEVLSFNNIKFITAYSPDGRKFLTVSETFELKIDNKSYGASYASILDATTGRTIGTIGYGPLNVGAKAFSDLQIARFLNNTAEVSKNEAVLKFITDKGYATRQEIEAFYRDNVRALIAGVVDEEFNKLSFIIEDAKKIRGYNVILTRNPQNGYYMMRYTDEKKITTELPPQTLEALLVKMQNNTADFDQACVNAVSAQAKLIPAVIYADWKSKSVAGGVDALALITETLINFYLTPNQTTYNNVLGIFARYNYLKVRERDVFADIAQDSLEETITALNPALMSKVTEDISTSIVAVLARTPKDPRFDIFLTRYGGR